MSTILLDCTLRDGGYINDWAFGQRRILGILGGLTTAGIDIIECGFLQDKPHSVEQALYNNVTEISSIIPKKSERTKFVAMMNSGEFDVSRLPDSASERLYGIRVVFHMHQADAALAECRAIKGKGYSAFLQPMGTDAYSDIELLKLVEKANELDPYAFYIVDSLGIMDNKDVVRLALLIHNNLKSTVALGFHSHNNLQLSFSNVQAFINMHLTRDSIVDSSVYGIGRGAGNLNTELIANYLNENHRTSYSVEHILQVFESHIRSLRAKFSWGYSLPYYLAAVHKCHPNYGTYMASRGTLPVTDIGVLLSKISPENKRSYSENLIESLYNEFCACKVNDYGSYEQLRDKLSGQPILLLAPGKSLVEYSCNISKIIEEQQPVVISINNVPEMYPVDYAFFSNRKRYEEHLHTNVVYIITSNVRCDDAETIVVDYVTLCNQQGRYSDNGALMLLSLLWRLGCESLFIAGLDGFTGNDYYEMDMQSILDPEWMASMNDAISRAVAQYSKHMRINFVTPSIYMKD